MNNLVRRLAPTLALCFSQATLAQPAQTDPASSSAPAPQLQYRSAFADYKPWKETRPGDWRMVNDTVRDAGAKGDGHGHGQGRGGAPSSAAPSPALKASGPGASSHQSGHGGHK